MDSSWELPSLKSTVKISDGGLSHACFDVKFYPYTQPGLDPVFAVCGDNCTIIGRCVLGETGSFEHLRIFEHDKDDAKIGDNLHGTPYNSLAWSQADNGDPLVCVAGWRSQINILNVATGKFVQTLSGHGGEILDLAVSPTDPTILASCSADNSIRIWSLHPSHQNQPLAAILYGQGHKDQVLTVAYHRKGRYILSAGMDTRINLWTIPDDVKDHAGTDKPAMVHYPHFSTTEVHTDFIDSMQWYGDLILSHACREDKIILWRIDNFSSDRCNTPPAPVPTSASVTSTTPVTIPAKSTSTTRSAWGGRLQRVLQFDLPHSQSWYSRFSIFHQLGRHPVLVAGNDKSKAFFWDLERLEKSHMGEEESRAGEGTSLPLGIPQHIREGSTTSNASSSVSVGVAAIVKKKMRRKKEPTIDRGISDLFHLISAHKVIEVPKHKDFTFRNFAWSLDGQWCVGVGDAGLMNIFHRWEKGVPPVNPDSDTTLSASEGKSGDHVNIAIAT